MIILLRCRARRDASRRAPPRQAHIERAALPDRALDPDPAAVELHELLRNGEPDAGAARPSRIAAAHLIEAREDLLPLALLNADPAIAHREEHLLPLLLQV